MKSLLVSSTIPLVFLLGAVSVHANLSIRQVPQIVDRSSYVGGWPLALAASQTSGCPSDAPVTAQNQYTTLECCPSGQTAFVDQTSFIQYCCPDKHDCHNAVLDFPACANSTWIMYQYFNGGSFFCCEPDQTATEDNGFGLCEPADVAVPTNMINKPISQDTVAPAAATTTTASPVVVVSTDTKLSAVTTTSTVGSAGTSSSAAQSTGTGQKVSSVATGSNSTLAAPSLGASATATTLASITGGNPAFTSSLGGTASASTSATPSAKTGGSGKVGVTSGAISLVAIALCFGVGAEILLG